jgi:putative endonuclease
MDLKFYFAYVLYSLKDEKFYIGFTGRTPEIRFLEHIEGKNISTAKRRPLELIYYEAHASEEDAKRRETYFKTTKGKTTLKQMLRGTLKNAKNAESEKSEWLV